MILADTNVVIWLALAPAKLSKTATEAIQKARGGGKGIGISPMSLLEIAQLSRKQRLHLHISLESFLSQTESRFSVMPITGQICAQAVDLPPAFPKDPADRIIAATALTHGLPLITADAAMRAFKGLQTVW